MFRLIPLTKHIASRGVSALSDKSRILICVDVTNKVKVARALADRIQGELNEVESVVDKTNEFKESPDVSFTVMITDQTMEDGILKLKYRSPRVTEDVHVTSLRDRLTQLTKAHS